MPSSLSAPSSLLLLGCGGGVGRGVVVEVGSLGTLTPEEGVPVGVQHSACDRAYACGSVTLGQVGRDHGRNERSFCFPAS